MEDSKELKLPNVRLENSRQVMIAFLKGHKLINSDYCGENQYLYLDEDGWICEEDGAGAKGNRVPLLMRNGEWWEIL